MTIKEVTVELREGIDGLNRIFSLPEIYLPGSIACLLINTIDSSSVPVIVEELGDSFFALEAAPNTDQFLQVKYNIEIIDVGTPPSGVPTLDKFEQKNINALIQVVAQQNELIKAMDAALKERVSRKEFDKWAAHVEAHINNLNKSIILLKTGK